MKRFSLKKIIIEKYVSAEIILITKNHRRWQMFFLLKLIENVIVFFQPHLHESNVIY